MSQFVLRISELKGSTSKDETIQIRITTLDSNYQDILYMILHYSLPYHIAEPVTLSLSITLRLKRPLHWIWFPISFQAHRLINPKKHLIKMATIPKIIQIQEKWFIFCTIRINALKKNNQNKKDIFIINI